MATPSNKSKTYIDLPTDLKLEFKVYCAQNQLNMTDVVTDLIRTFLSGVNKKGAM